jgi:sec1 family domain-containing protein 1
LIFHHAASILKIFQLNNDRNDPNVNVDLTDSLAWSDEWKVLVYDNDTKAIISPLLTVAELRSLGVTLHMSIDTNRDSIPDVSAVYFIQPTPTNLRHLMDDTAVGKYRDFSIHFTPSVPRQMLDNLAKSCVENGAVVRIRSIFDQYLNYIALESRLFSLNMQNSYSSIWSPSLTEADLEKFAKDIASSLLGVFATLNILPLIMTCRDGPSERIGALLDQMIRDQLDSGGGIFARSAGGPSSNALSSLSANQKLASLTLGANSRPVLLLLDRTLDLSGPLMHGSTYESLVDDTLGPISLNRVNIVGAQDASQSTASGAPSSSGSAASNSWLEWATGSSAAAGKHKGKTYTLDSDVDSFWRHHFSAQFPAAIEAHEKELAQVVAREAEIRKTTSSSASLAEEDAAANLQAASPDAATERGAGADLVATIDSLPALLRRKKVLQMHAELLQAVMNGVSSRLIPHFYELELTSLVTGMDRSAVFAMLGDAAKGTLRDRARLACIYLWTCSLSPSSSGTPTAASAPTMSSVLAEEAAAASQALAASAASAAPTVPQGTAPSPNAASKNAELASAQAALAYIRHQRATLLNTSGGFGSASASRFSIGGSLGTIPGGAAGNKLLSSLTGAASTFLSKAQAAATRLYQGETRAPITRILQSVVEAKPSLASSFASVDNFLVYDPKKSSSGGTKGPVMYSSYSSAIMAASSAAGNAASPPVFKNAFVFVTGGVSYAEYHDILSYASSSSSASGSSKTVVVGGSEILHSDAFLGQLETLGRGFSS